MILPFGALETTKSVGGLVTQNLAQEQLCPR
jgi:hypothetical protein